MHSHKIRLIKLNAAIDGSWSPNQQVMWTQARNQLGTPGEAKSFLRGAQIF